MRVQSYSTRFNGSASQGCTQSTRHDSSPTYLLSYFTLCVLLLCTGLKTSVSPTKIKPAQCGSYTQLICSYCCAMNCGTGELGEKVLQKLGELAFCWQDDEAENKCATSPLPSSSVALPAHTQCHALALLPVALTLALPLLCAACAAGSSWARRVWCSRSHRPSRDPPSSRPHVRTYRPLSSQ